jgi:predicted metalloprotease
MRFRKGAKLDRSQVGDLRGRRVSGGAPVALGGGGIVTLIIILAIILLGGNPLGDGTGGLGDLAGRSAGTQPPAATLEHCQTGEDANQYEDCRILAIVNSVQRYWSESFRGYEPARTIFFDGAVSTGCGNASSAVGPFYCPVDRQVYIDLGFFDELHNRFGVQGGDFVEAYVLTHEYGHHVQNLLGTSRRVDPRETGPTSGSVRLELQADCYAGVWANHATTVPTANGKPLIVELTQKDIDDAQDAASRIGDDYIQSRLGGGKVNPDAFTHGTSAQRRQWFGTGYQTGDPARCNTFDVSNLG